MTMNQAASARPKMSPETRRALSDLPTGARGSVSELHADVDVLDALAANGLIVGAVLSVLRNSGHGSILISVGNTHLALGRSEAAGIEVELIAAGDELAIS
jgi:Fe2+ transport system protein FeoA